MASSNVLGVQDAYQLINLIASQALGKTALTATDASSFVIVGEQIMQTGLESTLSAIGYVLGRTIFSIRPYRRKLSTMYRDPERFGMITRKITYLVSSLEQSQDWNTQLAATQLADGQSIDMYTIKAPKAVQLSFPGAEAMQDHVTRFRDQLRLAFSNEAEFLQFWEGVMVEFFNSIEDKNEAKTRAVVLNRIAGNLALGSGVVDLATEYNATFGTAYTREQLLTTYAENFWKFAAARIKADSDRLTDRSVFNHLSLTGYDPIVRHTPKDRQRMMMYNPAFIDAKANVWSSLFNPQYLDIGEFEGVNYWQSQQDPTKINYRPNVLNVSTGEANAAASAITHDYVLGILFDEEAMGIMPKFDFAGATPLNVAGNYYNLYYHWLFKMFNDYTENAIVYVIGDGGSAKLTALSIGALTLTPTFDDDVFSYTATTSNASNTITATAGDGVTVAIDVDGNAVTSGSSYTWETGENVVTITCTGSGMAPQTYTVVVTAS